MQCTSEGYAVAAAAFAGHELTDLRDGVEAAALRATGLAAEAGEAGVTLSDRGHRLQTVLGVEAVAPLSSKISFKRARVGSEFIWHQDQTFLAKFLGPAAREVVTAMVLLDDADAANGALTVIPGSHGGDLRDDDEPPRPGDAEPVLVEAPAGSVVFFHSLVLHRSDENRSERDRRAVFYLFRPAIS